MAGSRDALEFGITEGGIACASELNSLHALVSEDRVDEGVTCRSFGSPIVAHKDACLSIDDSGAFEGVVDCVGSSC